MWAIIRNIAINDFKIDFFEPYYEIVTFEEMLQIYSTSFPIMFNHWSFGKDFERQYKLYKDNRASIAYEVIFNTDPALCYLLETNTTTMQALVMSHAAVGHSSFFKTSALFQEHTNPRTIIPFLKNMRAFVEKCEQEHGESRVEFILDTCQALALYGINKAEKVQMSDAAKETKRNKRFEDAVKDFDLLATEVNPRPFSDASVLEFSRTKEENLLQFIANNAPNLKQWERDLINMYCESRQYFYPQMLTKVMNEGYASFWHYQLMHRLYDLNYLDDSNILEFLHSHTSVLCQRDHDEPGYHGLNPYKIGFEIFMDIKRICENPTEEDEFHFPDLIGKNWIEEVKFAVENFKDESFVLQYLSPKVVRDLKLFKVTDKKEDKHYTIDATHMDEDFYEIRRTLAEQFNFSNQLPSVYIEGADLKRTRKLYLVVNATDDRKVDVEEFGASAALIRKLWGFPVCLKLIGYEDDPIIAEI